MLRLASIVVMVLMVCTPMAGAVEIAGVNVPETVSQEDGTQLQLNGAGIRSKFIFKVYIAQLYLKEKATDSAAVIQPDTGKRMTMHFLHSEVGKDSLVGAWNDGFKGNGSKEQLDNLKSQIETFNAMFETVKEGDQILLDYVPGKGTIVSIKGSQKGVIPGKVFNDLLLSIWLGKKPVTQDLKNSLLGK